MVNYGIAYGLSAYGLADRLNIEQEEAGAYIERYFERFPAVKELHRGDDRVRQGERLRDDAARPPPADPRAALGPPPGPQPGRAARGQHADPGDLGGHHQDRDGPRPPGARRVGAGDPPGPPDPRRAPLRGPDGEMEAAAKLVGSARCAAPSSSTRRSRSTSASARTGWPRSRPAPAVPPIAGRSARVPVAAGAGVGGPWWGPPGAVDRDRRRMTVALGAVVGPVLVGVGIARVGAVPVLAQVLEAVAGPGPAAPGSRSARGGSCVSQRSGIRSPLPSRLAAEGRDREQQRREHSRRWRRRSIVLLFIGPP